jgi:hypothetical protein
MFTASGEDVQLPPRGAASTHAGLGLTRERASVGGGEVAGDAVWDLLGDQTIQLQSIMEAGRCPTSSASAGVIDRG